MQYFPHAEGYVQHVGGEFFYIYNYTDHLGNIRLSYTFDYASGLIKIMEENHYYPFGLKHDSYNTNRLGYSSYIDEEEISHIVLGDMPKFVGDGSYNYKYNGKELQDELGLNVYDLGARLYDPALARFMIMDPMADFVNYQSPYVASDDNPVLYRDEYGLGILNVIGNVFRRAKNGISRLFSGNKCDCGGREESISDSWRRADFPGINDAINNLFSGNGKSTRRPQNNSASSEKPFRGERQVAIDMKGPQIEGPQIGVPELTRYVYDTPEKKSNKPNNPVMVQIS